MCMMPKKKLCSIKYMYSIYGIYSDSPQRWLASMAHITNSIFGTHTESSQCVSYSSKIRIAGDHPLPSSRCVLEGKGNSSIENAFSPKLGWLASFPIVFVIIIAQ